MDRFNRPLPPAITRACSLTRNETLHLYYAENTWECWRPLFWIHDWSQSTFVDWLSSLGPDRTRWLRDVVLLYKHDTELEHNLYDALAALGIEVNASAISHKQELSEYEMSYEQLRLPRAFGAKRKLDRWSAGNASSN
ncbi:hypothetical protein LTR85_001734 [Meristemomyces frigidus]|nr:hypothetical protein LTR85_001734 [Meristemomyces frigidus]